ncbi:hypothetical protein BDW74DRAFT_177932 [Aspergillus multicolor]|uniref:uncharacterized protein n=1 Tax=Aspergillus multicolor TaxID=41759 RepID=UPI003CCCD938
MFEPAARIAAHVARTLDRVNVPNVLWGWAALALVQRDLNFPDIEFVINDASAPIAIAALIAEKYPHCVDAKCMELDEARMPNYAGILVDEKRRYHIVGLAHFHVPVEHKT